MIDLPENRDRIFEAAVDLFSKKGFRGTSIRDIAHAVDMSLSSIYHHFGNKEGLLLAILQRSAQRTLAELSKISELDMDPLDRFRKLVTTHILLAGGGVKEAKIFFLDEEHLSPSGNNINLSLQRQILGIYLKELRTLQSMGLVRFKSITVLAFNILGVINWCLRWYKPDGPKSLEEISQDMVSFVLQGMLGPGTGAV